MKTNDLKKGDVVMLANNWLAVIMDNKKGNTRLAEVHGIFVEMGSIYSHDIVSVLINNVWHPVEHTEDQLKLQKRMTSYANEMRGLS